MLGQTFLYLNQPSLAFHYLDKAVRMDPSNYITHNLLAQACKAIGQLEEATREFRDMCRPPARRCALCN